MESAKKLGVLGAVAIGATMASAGDNMVASKMYYGTQTGKYTHELTGLYDDGAAAVIVTHAMDEDIKKAGKVNLQATVATQMPILVNTYATAQADGTNVGLGAQIAAPKIGNDAVGLGANMWGVYYPESKVKLFQGNVQPVMKHAPAAINAVAPDNIKINVMRVNKENLFAGAELKWKLNEVKAGIHNTGAVGEFIARLVPDAFYVGYDKEKHVKHVAIDKGISL